MKKRAVKSRPTLIITAGDPEGIGPEVISKALRKTRFPGFDLEIHGRRSAFLSRKLKIPKTVRWVEPEDGSPGMQSGQAILTAVQSVMESPKNRALVTGPISKVRLNDAGFPYPGHTEFLAHLSGCPSVSMMLTNQFQSVVLATVHVSLADVPRLIQAQLLDQKLGHLLGHFHSIGIKKPKLAVLGLNPHCGEGGLLGTEEVRVIEPWVLSQKHHKTCIVAGPFSADTFFALEMEKRRFDGVIALYHDQGLAPLKAMDFSGTVNVTLGLPFIRTSVDHGTAFDIAGKNKANPSSMVAALKLAAVWLKKRKS